MCKEHRSADLSRRGFTGLVAGGAALALLPPRAQAQIGIGGPLPSPATLCLMCIDYRFVTDTIKFFDKESNKPHGSYDLVTLAGASLAAKFTTQFPSEFSGLWGQVDIAPFVHDKIKRVIVLDHSDCGAYKYVLGRPDTRADHLAVAREVQPWFKSRGLAAEFWLMANDDMHTVERILP